jgi:predicted nucleic acid-binding protein
MIVVDSSVWIGQFRGDDTRPVSLLNRLTDDADSVVVGDLVLVEVLRGARDDEHATRIERRLRKFVITPMLGESIAVQSARNYRMLRGRGVTVRSTIDVVIGTFCVERGHSLLHDDRDFDVMAPHIGLRVV